MTNGLTVTVVFLRALDYFQGILFLTTNRVGHFDEAFMSRIHLSLGYEKLTNNGRGRIWDNLFKKLGDDHKRGGPQINYEYHAKSYVKSSDVQSLEWNGREIRNGESLVLAISSARLLLMIRESLSNRGCFSVFRFEARSEGRHTRGDGKSS